jgi:D-lyxose ketol-isomerase
MIQLPATLEAVRAETTALIRAAGVHLSEQELAGMQLIDFGLGDIRREGVQYVDILLTECLRITVLALLPNQTLPQHFHPAYEQCAGKEESVRCVWGQFRIYLPGPNTITLGTVRLGKEQWYSARHEVVLEPGGMCTIAPSVPHWFQAGPAGAVTITFANRVDETRNRFADPDVRAICGSGKDSS